MVIGIGPLARKPKYRKVLQDTGGENLLFAYDYGSLDDHVNDIMNLVCREYNKFKPFPYFWWLSFTLKNFPILNLFTDFQSHN